MSILNETILLSATVYCLHEFNIAETNLILSKVYFFFLILLYGLIIKFKPFVNFPPLLRLVHLSLYLYVTTQIVNDWFSALLFSYVFGVCSILIYIRILLPSTRHNPHVIQQSLLQKQPYLFTSSMCIMSLSSSIPLIWGAHLNQP